MTPDTIKDIMYGSVLELLKNRKYYYRGTAQQFCHLTDEGQSVLIDYFEMMGYKMLESYEKDLDERAKNMVIKNLKGETK